MAYCFGSFRFLTLLVALCAFSTLTVAHAQQPTSSSANLAPDLTLLFETAPFIPDEHEVMEDEDTGLVVDGCEEFFGTDNSMPGAYLREAHVLLEGKWHALDTSCLYTCEFCSFDAAAVEVMPNPGGLGYRLEGRFSDGAGTYYATWLVTPTGTARTRIVAGPAAARLRARLQFTSRFSSFPCSCVGTLPGTLPRPLCDAGASRSYTPTEDRGSEQGKEVISGRALSMIDSVIDEAGSATRQLRMIDGVIDELRTLKRELEAGSVAAADAVWIREMIALLDMRRRADIER